MVKDPKPPKGFLIVSGGKIQPGDRYHAGGETWLPVGKPLFNAPVFGRLIARQVSENIRVAKCTSPRCGFMADSRDQKDVMDLLDVSATCPACGSKIEFAEIVMTIILNDTNRDMPITTEEAW